MYQTRELLTEREAADFLRLAAHTLATWRVTGRVALPYIKAAGALNKRGGKIIYRKSDLDAYLVSRTVNKAD